MTREDTIQTAYEILNHQADVADWAANDVYQFLLGTGLTDAEARELTAECRPGEQIG